MSYLSVTTICCTMNNITYSEVCNGERKFAKLMRFVHISHVMSTIQYIICLLGRMPEGKRQGV